MSYTNIKEKVFSLDDFRSKRLEMLKEVVNELGNEYLDIVSVDKEGIMHLSVAKTYENLKKYLELTTKVKHKFFTKYVVDYDIVGENIYNTIVSARIKEEDLIGAVGVEFDKLKAEHEKKVKINSIDAEDDQDELDAEVVRAYNNLKAELENREKTKPVVEEPVVKPFVELDSEVIKPIVTRNHRHHTKKESIVIKKDKQFNSVSRKIKIDLSMFPTISKPSKISTPISKDKQLKQGEKVNSKVNESFSNDNKSLEVKNWKKAIDTMGKTLNPIRKNCQSRQNQLIKTK
ncbi:MAG: hypothetical protein LBC92_05145 [Rickettsiales bacterium]|jgi:hypothetical protein|nr:hypothetical protein [Rickettsiales bacterium]